MARRTPPSRGNSHPEPPSEVPVTVLEVTIVPGPGGRTLPQRIADGWTLASTRVIVGLVIAVAAIGAILASALRGTRTGGQHGVRPNQSRREGAAGVAAAYRYPLGCLSVTIAAGDPAYARADFDRARPCGRYGGNPTAIFRRVNGAWRPVLDAVGYSCPVASLPDAVQADLDVCPQAATTRRSG